VARLQPGHTRSSKPKGDQPNENINPETTV